MQLFVKGKIAFMAMFLVFTQVLIQIPHVFTCRNAPNMHGLVDSTHILDGLEFELARVHDRFESGLEPHLQCKVFTV